MIHARHCFFATITLAGLTIPAPLACGGTGGGALETTEEQTAAGDSVGPSGSGSGAGGFDPFDAGTGGSSAGGAVDPDAACATSTAEATLVPVNVFVMFDKSGSMEKNGKWDDATAALTAFIQDPATAGLRVALRFFPDDGCDDAACDVDACSQPLVPIGALTADPAPADAQEEALVTTIAGKSWEDGGGTPISAALEGATKWAAEYLAAHASEKAAVIFVTDGGPNGCNEDGGAIQGIAGAAFTASGVTTYAVGLEGSNEGLMDDIAQAGGTSNAFFIGSGADAQKDLVAALEAIQGSVIACELAMPQGSPEMPVDPTKVNVDYTPGGTGPVETFAQVPGAADCGNGGWYYDDPASPTKITLCPSTCGAVQGDPHAKLEVLLGCATKIAS